VPATVIGIQGELIVNGAVGILMGLWAIIPFIDRRSSRGLKSPVFTAIGILLIVYLGGTIAAALLT